MMNPSLCFSDYLYRVNRRDISYLRFILEAYDGLAVLTTVVAPEGVIRLSVAPGREDEAEWLLHELTTEECMRIEPLDGASRS